MDNVKCIDCGFLTALESTKVNRQEGYTTFSDSIEVPMYPELDFISRDNWQKDITLCFINKANLTGYADVNRSRNCDGFRHYQYGLTPKEHLERQELEEERKWQEKMARIGQQTLDKGLIRMGWILIGATVLAPSIPPMFSWCVTQLQKLLPYLSSLGRWFD